jgi:hypothetical protein
MEVHIPKWKVMHLDHQSHPQTLYVMGGGQVLASAEEEKDFNVTITNNLKPTALCATAAKTGQTV